MKAILLTMLLSIGSLQALAQQGAPLYPILSIPRSEDSTSLLAYKLTPPEKQLFKEIDTETAKLPENAELSAYHEVAIRIGKRYGLTRSQSIAFFTRTTFSEFEP